MILLDTCVLFWLEDNPAAISALARHALADPTTVCFASSISALELGLKVAAGRLKLPLPPAEWLRQVCERRGIIELPVHFGPAGESALLPSLHKDPFDRLIIATALSQNLTIVTSDKMIPQYPGVKTLW